MEERETPEIDLLVRHIKDRIYAISNEISEMPGEWGEEDENGDRDFINEDTEAFRIATEKEALLSVMPPPPRADRAGRIRSLPGCWRARRW